MSQIRDFQHFGKNVTLENGVFFGQPQNISIGSNVFIGKNAQINAGKGGFIQLSDGCAIGAGSTIITWNLNNIGNKFLERNLSDDLFKDVFIGKGVGLGYGCIVNAGTSVGEGAEVAAGSVLQGEVLRYEVVGCDVARVLFVRGS